MDSKKLSEYLADPIHLHNMGLVFWLNKSVADIGAPMTIQMMSTYIAKTINALGLEDKDKMDLADHIYEEMVSNLLNSDIDLNKYTRDIQ